MRNSGRIGLIKSRQKMLDDHANAILIERIDHRFIELLPINGNYPGIDGLIQSVDSDQLYTSKYLLYQLKGVKNKKQLTFSCQVKYLKHWAQSNIPVLLIVVDVASHHVVWQLVDNLYVEGLKIDGGQKTKTIIFNPSQVIQEGFDYLSKWRQAASRETEGSIDIGELKEIVQSVELKAKSLIGALYLFGPMQIDDKAARLKIKAALKLSDQDFSILAYEGIKNGSIRTVGNIVLIDNKDVGLDNLQVLLSNTDFDFTSILGTIIDNKQKTTILRHLSEAQSTSADKFLIYYAKQIYELVLESKNNDDNFLNLGYLHEFINRVPNVALKIIRSIMSTKTPHKPTVYSYEGFGKFQGKSHSALVLKCVELLDDIRYLEIKSVFPILVQLASYPDDAVQSKSKEVLKNLFQYNLFVLQKIGYYPQLFLIDTFDKWTEKTIALRVGIVMVVAEQLLQPSFEGHSMSDYKTFTIHQGPLVVNDDLKRIRRRTLNMLRKMFLNTQDVQTKRQILQAMQGASQTPYQGDYGDDLKQMVIDDTNWLIDFYLETLSTASLEVIKQLEEQVHWFHRRLGPERHPRLTELKSAIEVNSEYDMFRVFVGYEYRINEELDWKEADRVRKEKIQSFVDTLNPSNYPEWRQRILSVRSNYTSSDIGEFQYFGLFLFELGKQKPDIGLRLISDNEKQLEPFLFHLVAGIWKSSLADRAKEIVSRWIAESKYLPICAYIFDYIQEIDIGILQRVFVAASKNKDVTALYNIIGSIARNYDGSRTLRSLFMNTIKQFTKNHSFTWVNNLWFRHSSILENLDEKDFDLILKNLLLAPRIDYHSEEILSAIATKHPKKIISFFKNRVAIKASRKDVEERYEAIPFTLHKLNISLQKHVKIVVREIFEWISSKGWLLEWEGSHFIQKIFSTFDPELEKELITLLKSGTSQDAEIVLRVLRSYKGEPFLHNTCKELIKQHPKNEKYQKDMFIVLFQTGIVSGEYGFVEAYKRKKDEVQGWKQDKSIAVRDFASQYEAYLDKLIAYEQKKADEDIELRKRDLR